jgi:hypothetical protein
MRTGSVRFLPYYIRRAGAGHEEAVLVHGVGPGAFEALPTHQVSATNPFKKGDWQAEAFCGVLSGC